jgi:CheY-like chemotaxis protein
MAEILVVDDEAAIRRVIELMLSRNGHVVTTADDGSQALAMVDKREFDLVITDLVMPGKEGIETIMTLRKKHPAVKIVAMSGGGQRSAGDYLSVAQMLGAAEVLPKPFTQDQLLRVVESALNPK